MFHANPVPKWYDEFLLSYMFKGMFRNILRVCLLCARLLVDMLCKVCVGIHSKDLVVSCAAIDFPKSHHCYHNKLK